MIEVVDDMLAGIELPAKPLYPVSVTTAPPAGPMATAMQALSAGMKLDDLRGLLDLQKDWEANEARKAYVADMAAFKLDPPEIFKTKAVAIKGRDNKEGPAYSHATLGDVCEKIVEGLAKHGFSHRWDTKQPDGGQIFVTCTLTHRLGHSESTTLNSSRDDTGQKNNIQAMASTVSYLQRYTLLGASGLATKDMPPDDDGAGSGGSGETKYDSNEAVQHWTGMFALSKTLDSLGASRQSAALEFEANKDVAGWELVKKAVVARRAEIEAADANPVVKTPRKAELK
jgi:hypothetical protein